MVGSGNSTFCKNADYENEKSLNIKIFFCILYSKPKKGNPFLTSTRRYGNLRKVPPATFLQLGSNYAILLNRRNFSAFKFSNVSYCFAIRAITHKISKVFAVTCVDVFVQIEQSFCIIWHKNSPYVLQNCFFLAPRYTLTRQNKAQ